ncbi:glycosyltransferase family 4 protein [Pseudovibrio sp. POLY-S9]|uniref:glycosyltransferase family 4 protein n=1 Tax=Pseudovibrio sp. POLY-S9 TaxID=1576596 RepID=UPI00070ED4A9|nr:glycosyltransferase family 4 protein [Pseudovibrio sp. POLY-S9]
MKEIQALTDYMKTTVAYKAGLLLIDSRNSLKSAFLLPLSLYRLNKAYKKYQFNSHKNAVNPHLYDDEILEIILCKTENIYEHLQSKNRSDNEIAHLLIEASRVSLKISSSKTRRLAEEAYRIAKTTSLKKRAAILMYDGGSIITTSKHLSTLGLTNASTDDVKVQKIFDEEAISRNGFALINKQIRRTGYKKGKIAYISHLCVPFHTSGYATRTHSILQELSRSGAEVVCITRPGYPWDRADSRNLHDVKNTNEIENVIYRHISGPNISGSGILRFVEEAATKLIEMLKSETPEYVVAGSNYVNALPALIASRHLGIDFIYDVRGLWEYTSASKIQGWEQTDRFNLSRNLETLVANASDAIFAISSPLKDELISRGVQAEKIKLLPNGVHLEKFDVPLQSNEMRHHLNIGINTVVYGFIGSLEVYEGLEDVLHSFKMVLDTGVDCKLVIVGDGACSSVVSELTLSLGISEFVHLTGRIPFSEVNQYYCLCDVFVYPRVETAVTKIIPALKPLEAMAARKPVIISRLPALIELVGGVQNAEVVQPGNCTEISNAMLRLCDEEKRNKLGLNGYNYVSKEKTWQSTCSAIKEMILK